MTDESRKHLEDLHGRLTEAADGGNAEAGEMRDRIDAYLSSDAPSDDDHKDFLESLGDTARRFEVEHPTLSQTLQHVIDSLTAAGI